jgi:hypothetical protein
MALPPPFPTAPQRDSLVRAPVLQSRIDELGRTSKYSQVGFAVADLSDHISRFGGWNLDKPRYSGSVLKIAALFAALQLRERLNLAAKGVRKDDLFKVATAEWFPRVSRSVAGEANFPQLDTIFWIKPDGEIEFTMDFAGKLGLMVSYSDTASTGVCIRALGHQYINGALAAEGLYSAKTSGLWLGGDYADTVYGNVPGGSTWFAATPTKLLRFLDLLNSGHLVSASASDKMKRVMEDFWTLNDLRADSRGVLGPPESFGKLGWGFVNSVKTFFDAGVVHRRTDRGNFRYAIVILGLPRQELGDLALQLDDIIIDWHFTRPEAVGRHRFV